jgi:ABC-type sugar transport system ATPase subunit
VKVALRACVCDLELAGIRKQYEGVARPVIPDLDLVIPTRKMVVLVGPSGCGKSTTLRMVAGLEEPTAGTIKIDGRDVTHLPPAERDIAMVFQSYALYPHMSVFENMAFGLRIKNVGENEIKRRVITVAQSLGLEPYLERRPKALSGGQRQRVAIGRAVVRQPKVFLFDEPLSNLDAKLRGDMRREIARIHQSSNATAMYVTHDQIEAMTLADQIVVLKDGVVQQIGTPVEIYERPANRFVAGFFGTPTMNFLTADLAQTGEQHAARGPGFEIPLSLAPSLRPANAALDKVVVGIRPERLSLERRADAVGLSGAVAMREVLGAEVVLHLDSQAGPLTVRTDAGSAPRPGDTVQVWLDPHAIHVFHGATEVRL